MPENENTTQIATQLELVFMDMEALASESEKCPECGSEYVVRSGHCATCFECGWSLCSL